MKHLIPISLISTPSIAALITNGPEYLAKTPFGEFGIYVLDTNYCTIVVFNREIQSRFNFETTIILIAVSVSFVLAVLFILITKSKRQHEPSPGGA